MKKKLLFIMLLVCSATTAQIVNIPDPVFKNLLLSANTTNSIAMNEFDMPIKIDINNDGEIQESEALLPYRLGLTGQNINDATGINAFSNLKLIYLGQNNMNSLDVSQLSNLLYLYCQSNNLTSLNISGLNNLIMVEAADNELSYLDVSGLTALEVLSASYNQFVTFDFSALPSLREISFTNNPLSSLIINNPTLQGIWCSYTNIVELNLSSCSALQVFDVSNCPNLTYINLKNGSITAYIEESHIWGSPNLEFICVDEGEATALLENSQFQGIVLDTDCSLADDSNTIVGAVLFNWENNDCGVGSLPLSYVRIKVNENTVYTNAQGQYKIFTQDGSYSLMPEFVGNIFSASPLSANVEFPVTDNLTSINDFCVNANGFHNDVEIAFVPLTSAQPGFDADYKIVYKNSGNQTVSGTITLEFNDDVIDLVETVPIADNSSTGLLTFNFTDLHPFESRSIFIRFNINGPMETPPVVNGNVLNYTASITTTETDEILYNNVMGIKQIVVGSFDPNDIICLEGATVAPDKIGEFLHYNINFENTGTAAATFVVVETELNESQFNISSLEVLEASDPMITLVEGNKATFRLDNINLGPEEKGNIVYKIKTKNSLQVGDAVTQQANIFFDYNFPIETNEATTTFVVLSVGKYETGASIKVYPNPSNGIVNITADSDINSFELYDIQGRLLQSVIVNETAAKLDISGRALGMYFVKVKTEKGVKVEKILKN